MTTSTPDLVVLYEHPEWQKPLFAALERRGVSFAPFDVDAARHSAIVDPPAAPLYFNQASPSAYVRGNTRAVPLALAYMRSLERLGARVLNGADVFALELSKSAQATLLRTLGIDTPALDHVQRCRARCVRYAPATCVAGAAQAGPGRQRRAHSGGRVDGGGRSDLRADPDVWLPDNLFLLQEYLPHDPDAGHRAPGVPRRRAAVRHASEDARAFQSLSVAGLQSGRAATARARCRRSSGCGAAGRVLSIPGGAARGGRDRASESSGRRGSTSAGSSIWKPTTAAACSTTSTPTRTCGHRSPRRAGFDPFERVVDFLVRQLVRT